MKKFFRMFGVVGLLAGMMMLAGCGDDAAPAAVAKAAQPLTGATVAAGTVTVATASVATTAAGVTALAIPAGATFTGTALAGGAITAVPTVTVTTPVSGLTAMTQPTSGSTNFTVQSAAGAIDIAFDGLASAVFAAPVKVSIPVTGLTAGATVSVLSVKASGASSVLSGTVNAGATAVDVNVTNFCTFYVAPVFTTTGGTGGTGTIGSLGIK